MREALLILIGLVVAPFTTRSQDAIKTDAVPSTVTVVGNGVFAVPEGQSTFIEQFNNQILLAFPAKRDRASRDAHWPGPIDERKPCTDLAPDEYELVIDGNSVCVRMGSFIDTMRSIGNGTAARYFNGGCNLYIVRVEKRGLEERWSFGRIAPS